MYTIKQKNVVAFFIFLLAFSFGEIAFASGEMDQDEIKNIRRVAPEDKNDLSITAGLLAQYEIVASKITRNIHNKTASPESINTQAIKLLDLSEAIIDSARQRLPQCKLYLDKTLTVRKLLNTISHQQLEKDFHHDGALPQAGVECYHIKDLFIHPITVLVLTRDDPALMKATKTSILAEINEVLAHTELVRQLIIYE